jgi:hypothetical protein
MENTKHGYMETTRHEHGYMETTRHGCMEYMETTSHGQFFLHHQCAHRESHW